MERDNDSVTDLRGQRLEDFLDTTISPTYFLML